MQPCGCISHSNFKIEYVTSNEVAFALDDKPLFVSPSNFGYNFFLLSNSQINFESLVAITDLHFASFKMFNAFNAPQAGKLPSNTQSNKSFLNIVLFLCAFGFFDFRTNSFLH